MSSRHINVDSVGRPIAKNTPQPSLLSSSRDSFELTTTQQDFTDGTNHTACQQESQPLVRNAKEIPSVDRNLAGHHRRDAEPFWKIWYLETISSLLALGCLLAIVIVLSVHQGQPVPNWPELISINSLMAIFTAIFKASLIMPVAEGLGRLKWEWFNRPHSLGDIVLFDDASRGPWGSLVLIVKQLLRQESSHVASIGALITIGALAIDPFSQAMVQHRPCLQAIGHATAETTRTNNYSSVNGRYNGVVAEESLDPAMLAALYKGLVDPEETESLIDAKCTTGNCTFGDEDHGGFFSSLAMCHSCQNITDQIREESESYTYTLPSGLSVTEAAERGVVLSAKVYSAKDYDDPTFFGFETLLIRHVGYDDFLEIPEPAAVRCTLAPCVERYRAGVTNGKYWEAKSGSPGQELKRCPIDSSHDRPQAAYALATNTSLIDGRERPCVSTTERVPGSVMFDTKSNAIHGLSNMSRLGSDYEPDWKFYPRECVWAFDMTAWVGIGAVLRRLVDENVTMADGLGSLTMVSGPLWLKRAYAEGNGSLSTVEDMARGLADTMTAAIRNSPSTSRRGFAWEEGPTALKHAYGTVNTMQTCIYVQWGWIAYPAALFVLQGVFSMLVLVGPRMTRTRGGPRPSVWKSSPLALLFHGIDKDVRRDNMDLRTVDEMDKAARMVKVQLSHVDGVDDKGWRFCAS